MTDLFSLLSLRIVGSVAIVNGNAIVVLVAPLFILSFFSWLRQNIIAAYVCVCLYVLEDIFNDVENVEIINLIDMLAVF